MLVLQNAELISSSFKNECYLALRRKKNVWCQKTNEWLSRAMNGGVLTTKGNKGTPWGDIHVLDLGCGGGYTAVYNWKNSLNLKWVH